MEIAKKSYELATPCESRFYNEKIGFYPEFQTLSQSKGLTGLPSTLENYFSKFDLTLRSGILYNRKKITKNKFKLFPEKPYELAQSYELAPYELAKHPCILET